MFVLTRKIVAGLVSVAFALTSQAESRLEPSQLLPIPSSAAVVHPESVTIAYSSYLWPKVGGVATVYYIIDSASDPNATSKIQAAISIFNTDFPGLIQWVPWKSALGPNYVDINLSATNFTGQCEANEGYETIPAQPMTGSTSCTIGTLLHEMGHVIGLWHEQARADRGTYITLTYGNVIKGSWSNFLVQPDDEEVLTAYDYASVMQYIPYAFSRDGAPVIETIPAGIPLAGYEGVPAQAGSGGTPALPAFDYSAGDKESIERLYGAPPTQVTVTSNPVGLSVIVDGMTVTTPQTYSWALYSMHTLNVAAEVQTAAGAVLNSNPAVAQTYYYTYGRWSDSTAQSHSIMVVPGNGSLAFPKTAPQVTTYSANFVQLVPYTAAVYPSASGQVAVSPQPQTYSGVSGEFFVARQLVTLTATASTGWSFYEFNNSPYWLPGGLGANPKEFYVPDTGNPVNTTAEFSNTPVYKVDVAPDAFDGNTYVYVDSGFSYTPKNFSAYYDSSWTVGSTHTLSLDAAEYPYSVNSRYNFVSWNDKGALTHSITLPAAAKSYVATLTPEFQPATNFSYPPCGGSATVSPGSPTSDGFYPKAQVLSFNATPAAGWTFAGWSYDVTGSANPAALTANAETLVFANFNTTATPLTLTSLAPASALVGRAAFTLTLTGTGFAPSSLVSVNASYRTVTYVSATKLTVPVTAADVATLGAFQVFVENFPSGWNGCAVFGYKTFQVTGNGPPAAPPTYSVAAGTYTTPQSVAISDVVSGATIYYTTDGTGPSTTSPVYSTPISVSITTTLKAIAEETGWSKSAVATSVYQIKAQTQTPTFSPVAATYAGPQSVTISDATSGAIIYYTTDKTPPTTASTKYTSPITVSATTTIKAIAVAAGDSTSAASTSVYVIK